MDDVEGKVIGPIPSKDGQAAQTVVTYNLGANGWNKMPGIAEEIHEIAKLDGANVYIAGAGGQAVDSAESFEGLDGKLLLWALLAVILLLLITYRSPILWILPIFSVIVALGTSLGLIYFLAKYADLTVNGQSQAIVSILVIGAGTDYALLLIARYREELRRHEDRHEAMAFALHRATPAIIASAATVIVGMLCLTLAEMNSTAGMGPVVRHRHRRDPARDDHAAAGAAGDLRPLDVLAEAPDLRLATSPPRPASGPGSGNWIAPRPRRVWIGTALVLGACALGVLTLEHQRPLDRGVLHQGVRLGEGPEGAHRARPGRQLDPRDGGRQRRPGRRRRRRPWPASTTSRQPSEPVVKDGVAFITANLTVDCDHHGGLRHRRRGPDRGARGRGRRRARRRAVPRSSTTC